MPNQEIGSSGEVKWLQLISKQIIQLTGTVSAISGGGGGGVIGSGLTNYIARWSSTSGITNSQIYDNGTNVMIGTTTDSGGRLQVVGLVNAGGYKTPTGASTDFLKADGSVDSTAYAIDGNLVHRTGDEAITGKKSFQNSGGNAQIIMNTTGGSGANAPIYITNPGKGHGIYIDNQSTGAGLGLNNTSGTGFLLSSSSPAQAISISNTASGIALSISNSGTGYSILGTDGGIQTFSVNKTGTVVGNVLLLGGAADNLVDKLIVTGSAAVTLDSVFNGVKIGRGSGSVTTNTVLGSNILVNNTTGGNIIAIGNNVLTNTSGVFSTLNCIGIGQSVLMGAMTNSSGGNIAIGYQSSMGTTGEYNVSVGYQSLRSNINGSYNTSIGYRANYSLSSTGGNVALGGYTMLLNANGTNNTGLGFRAGMNFDTGDNNVFLGYFAGSYLNNKSTTLTNVNNSIFIGQFTSALANTSTNQIVIGDNANGAGSNTTVIGNDSVVTTALKGNTLIGYTGTLVDDGLNKLQVNGYAKATGYRVPGGLATQFLKADGSVSLTTQLGANLFNFSDPNAETFIRINADNTLSALDAATFRTAIGAIGSNAVTSVFGRTGAVVAVNGDYTTALVPDTLNKRYQTDNQSTFNDATSSIQTQLNNKPSLTGTGASGTWAINVSGSAASLSANLPVNRLNSGTNASATTYWRGDGAWVSPFLSASALLDFPNTGGESSSDLTIPLVGAALGDVVSLGVPAISMVANINYSAWVSAVNVVTVRFNNYSSGAKNPAVGTFKVTIIK